MEKTYNNIKKYFSKATLIYDAEALFSIREILMLFKPFVEDELPAIIRDTTALLAHPQASASCPRGLEAGVTLAVGPEGGFIPYEIEKLTACGFVPVKMGERTLSVESAVPALLARLF